MAWFTRFTRFGDMHFVYGQEHDMTCGLASVLMCVMKINKIAPGRTALRYESEVIRLYSSWLGQAYTGDQVGTYPQGLVSVLNQLNCGRWTSQQLSPTAAAQKIIDTVGSESGLGPTVEVNPVIIGVNWDGSTASHWVVIDTVRSFLGRQYATVCDPWDADVHVTAIQGGSEFVYDAHPVISFDVWGQRKSYSGDSIGRIRSWPMIYRT